VELVPVLLQTETKGAVLPLVTVAIFKPELNTFWPWMKGCLSTGVTFQFTKKRKQRNCSKIMALVFYPVNHAHFPLKKYNHKYRFLLWKIFNTNPLLDGIMKTL
jgi:hypothetical protein